MEVSEALKQRTVFLEYATFEEPLIGTWYQMCMHGMSNLF
jgi:hypothetical protein